MMSSNSKAYGSTLRSMSLPSKELWTFNRLHRAFDEDQAVSIPFQMCKYLIIQHRFPLTYFRSYNHLNNYLNNSIPS